MSRNSCLDASAAVAGTAAAAADASLAKLAAAAVAAVGMLLTLPHDCSEYLVLRSVVL